MFCSPLKLNRIKETAEYFALYDLSVQKDFNELIAIINVFNLENCLLSGSLNVPEDSKFLDIKCSDVDLKIIKTQKRLLSKKIDHDIEISFKGSSIRKVMELLAKEDLAIWIVSAGNDNRIEMSLNDNDHNFITFSTILYDVNEVKKQIKTILKNKVKTY